MVVLGSGVAIPLERPSVGMIFVNVNQVLVRLWARRGRTSDRMWSVLRDGSSRDRGNVFRGVLCACHRVALLQCVWGLTWWCGVRMILVRICSRRWRLVFGDRIFLITDH
jgi:hypothetical protein